jgi:pyruvate/2-oxoglutarate dehydrogenase complex dihydrolipoamide dehydrogenase (E3) component
MELVAIYDNESIWNLPELPNRVLFIGAGPINMELAHALVRLGSEVQIVEQANTLLTREDPEISEVIYQQSKALGINFHFNTELLGFIDSNTALLQADDEKFQLTLDIVVVGIGREINFSGLNPEAAGIKIKEDGRLSTDEYQRTSNKNVLVIGDAAGGPQFSHGAEHQATILIKNLFSPIKQKVTYENFSWVTFTEPEVATFGFNQHQLNRKGQKYHKLILPLDEDDRAVTDNYQYGKLILFIGKSKLPWSNPKLLGGSLVAPNAGEIIQELILAKTAGLGIKSLFNKIYPYPTASRINKTIVLHKYTGGITPWMKRILRLFY